MRNASFGGLIVAALLACYLINCFSPLRLEYDSIHYFALKDCLEHSCPPGFLAAADPHPYGYPLLLWLLSRMGLLHPFVIAFINLLYLAGALYFTGKLFQAGKEGLTNRRLEGLANHRLEFGVILLLLSYPFIKFFAYPLSEMQYLFFSCGSLYFFRLYTDRGMRPGAFVLSFLFAGAAIFTRTAGIVLLPALLAGLVWHHSVVVKRFWWVGVLIGAGGVIVGVMRINPGLYMNSVLHPGPGWKELLQEHLAEWGQLLLNVPAGKVAGIGRWVFIVLGVGLLSFMGYSLIRWRKKVPVPVSVYLVLYSVLIFCWPFFDVRFWIPAAPFIVMIILFGSYPKVFRWVVIVFMLAGVAGMGYSTNTAFNKAALARNQAGGRYRNEYETYFFGKPLRDSAAVTDPYVLHVLETCK